jgi:hypothetical protein
MQPILDLTGKPAGYSSACLGKRLDWRAYAKLTATKNTNKNQRVMVEVRPFEFVTAVTPPDPMAAASYVIDEATTSGNRTIPEGAVLRPRVSKPRPEPRPVTQYWLGRKCIFPMRYTDPLRHWRGWKPKPSQQASQTMLTLLRPLSALSRPRFYFASQALTALLKAPVVRRVPLAEEHTAGRLSARHMNGADWFANMHSQEVGISEGMRCSSGGEKIDCSVRDPLALWPAEASADASIRLRSRFRTLGPLARIVWRALNGAEMADLAPAWNFAQRNKAEAGRIRLRAGLEICARMAEREVDRLPAWEVLEVMQAACSECAKLEATRRIRVPKPANDNTPQRIAA